MGILENVGLDAKTLCANAIKDITDQFNNQIDLLNQTSINYQKIKEVYSDFFSNWKDGKNPEKIAFSKIEATRLEKFNPESVAYTICKNRQEDILEAIQEIQSWPASYSIRKCKEIEHQITMPKTSATDGHQSCVLKIALNLKVDGESLRSILGVAGSLLSDFYKIELPSEVEEYKKELFINDDVIIEEEIKRLKELRIVIEAAIRKFYEQ